MTTAMNQVLHDPNGPGRIIFGDFLENDRRLWRVSRAFRAASRNALVHVGSEILGRRVATQKPPRPEEVEAAEARLPQVFAELKQKIEGVSGARDLMVGLLISHWDATVQIYNRWMQEPEGDRRNQHICLLAEHLETSNQNFDAYADQFRRYDRVRSHDFELIEHLSEIVMRDRLERRFAEVVESGGLDSRSPEAIASCFVALRQNQRESMRKVQPRFAPLAPPENYSASSFRRAEEIVFDRLYWKRDRPLLDAWTDIRPQIHAGPDANTHSAFAVREWMSSPENAPLLSQVEQLRITANGRGMIPPEMGRFSGLKKLLWCNDSDNDHSPSPHLPEELANLQQLETLRFVDSGFAELPAVLTRLPALRDLTFIRNRREIRELPDAFERHFHSGLANIETLFWYEGHRAQCLLAFLGIPSGDHIRGTTLNAPYFGLNYTHFTEIPFRVWFRETVALPNIPVAIIFLLLECLIKLKDSIKRACDIQRPNVWVDEVLSFAWIIVLCAPTLFFALPFMLINFVLNLVVEPIITAVRDHFGYNRMVHVERNDWDWMERMNLLREANP